MKIVLSIVAGIGGVVALTVAYRRQDLGEATDHREETRLFTERFAKAAEQLGSDQAAQRLAGAYAMARLADDWNEDRQTCIDVLCAYLRMPYDLADAQQGADGGMAQIASRRRYRILDRLRRLIDADQSDVSTASLADKRDPYEERQVRHTVIRLIAAHLRPGAPVTWQRHHFDFTGAVFDGGDLRGVEVTEGTSVDFTEAKFACGTVGFSGAEFSGGTIDFSRAEFSGGTIYFDDTRFSGGMIDFYMAEFSDGIVFFAGAEFSGGTIHFGLATFSGGSVLFDSVRFSGGKVAFNGAQFSGGTVGLSFAEFSDGTVDFYTAQFSDGMVNLIGAKFSGGTVNFEGAEFSGGTVNFGRAEFSGGTVDLRKPASWRTSPVFDTWEDGPPSGVLLPSAERQREVGA